MPKASSSRRISLANACPFLISKCRNVSGKKLISFILFRALTSLGCSSVQISAFTERKKKKHSSVVLYTFALFLDQM